MAIDKKTVEDAANLARIRLESTELEKLAVQLKGILDFIDKLNKVDVSKISPTSHILPVSNVLREDIPGRSLASEKVLENAPKREGNSFVVPKVIE